MNPGSLDRRITLEAPVTTRGESGGVMVNFTAGLTRWAQKLESTGREFRAVGAVHAETTIAFRIRYVTGLTTQHRLTYEGRFYDILQINEEGRKTFQLIQARTTEGAAA